MAPSLFSLALDPGKMVSKLLSLEFAFYGPFSSLCAFLTRHAGSAEEANTQFEHLFKAVAAKNEEYSEISIAFRELHHNAIHSILRRYEQVDLDDKAACAEFSQALQLAYLPLAVSQCSETVVLSSLRPRLRAACRTIAVKMLAEGVERPRGRTLTMHEFKSVRKALNTILSNLELINPGSFTSRARTDLEGDITCAVEDIHDGTDEDKHSAGFLDEEVRLVLLGSSHAAAKPSNRMPSPPHALKNSAAKKAFRESPPKCDKW